jgi:NADH:ubiquinone oxidoreductase subunit 6 (subunit J)
MLLAGTCRVVFRRPVYSGMCFFFVAAPLGILWLALGDAWIGILSLVAAAGALALIPLDLRRNAFEMRAPDQDAFKGKRYMYAVGAAIPVVVLALSALIYFVAR